MKNFKFIISLFSLLLFCSPLTADAYLAPNVYISDIKINNQENYTINGEFTVKSRELYYLIDLNYEIKLFKYTINEGFSIIDIFVPNEVFSIQPETQVFKTFNYKYPQNITSGDYILSIQAITKTGIELGWQDYNIKLEGKNNFLDISTPLSKILYNEKEYTPLEGVNIEKNDNIAVNLIISNPKEEITVTPHIKIFKRQINMDVVKEYQDNSIIISQGEKNIQLEMLKIDNPGTYLAEVKFYNNNEQISDTEYFRWVVRGDGGQMLGFGIDKDHYKAGEKINITVDVIGPADTTDIGTGKLMISIYDNNNLIKEDSKDILLNDNVSSLVFSIPVKKDLLSPNIKLKILKNENVLNEFNINLPILSDEAKLLEKNIFLEKILKISLLIILILAILIYIFYIKHKFKIKK